MSDRENILTKLLSPSWLSGLIVILAGLIITAGTIVVFSLDNSGIKQQLASWQQNRPKKTASQPIQYVPPSEHPQLHDSWPLLIVWGMVGLVVYYIAASAISAANKAADIKDSLNYVNARPHQILENAIEHIVMRTLAVFACLGLAWLFFKETFSYSITASHAAAVEPATLNGFVYTLLSFAIVVVNLHLVIIFARLAGGRTRLFSTE